jgi:hypothetical protein
MSDILNRLSKGTDAGFNDNAVLQSVAICKTYAGGNGTVVIL